MLIYSTTGVIRLTKAKIGNLGFLRESVRLGPAMDRPLRMATPKDVSGDKRPAIRLRAQSRACMLARAECVGSTLAATTKRSTEHEPQGDNHEKDSY
jgi:hypothetical protein